MRKVIFIINSISNQRCIKRINEFIENDYEIKAYSFTRKGILYKQPNNFNVEIVGDLEVGGYASRVKVIVKAVKYIRKQYKNDKDVLFYYFGLDIGLIASTIIKNEYIYEVSDLSQTYIENPLISKILDLFDKRIIKRSFETVFTSEGFIQYHFKNGIVPENISVIPNRVNKECLNFKRSSKTTFEISNVKFGFVGFIRYKSILNFAMTVADNFPEHEFHFYGTPPDSSLELNDLMNKSNVYFHGRFNNPADLPRIYQSIDIVLSTYDIDIENVKYAEPNKMYEAVFFRTPIVVSENTFLAEKVKDLEIGYVINALNTSEIIEFIENLTEDDVNAKIKKCYEIPPSFSIDNNKKFFEKIGTKIK